MARVVALVAVLSLAACMAVQGAQVPQLPQACINNRTQACCPGLVTLLEMEADGCSVDSITQAATTKDAKSNCTKCGTKFSAIATSFASKTGPACALVQQHVSLFPFACASHGNIGNCLLNVKQVVAGTMTAAQAVQTKGMCGSYSCWGDYLRHMRTTPYNLAGQAMTSYIQRIGGNTDMAGADKLLACAKVGNDYCINTIVNYTLTPPQTLTDFTPSDSAPYCSGCERLAFSNAVNLADSRNWQYSAETYRRLALGGCSGGCTASWLSMKAGHRDWLDQNWAACNTLYDPSPTCSTECEQFGTLLHTSFGCCTRFALETATIAITRRGSSAIPGNGASVSEFLGRFNQFCGVNPKLMTACNKDYSLPSTPNVEPADQFTVSVTVDPAPSDITAATTALGARVGALSEDFDGSIRGNVLDLTLSARSVSQITEAGDAFTSLAYSGGLATMVAGTATVVDPAVPAAADLIQDYFYVPQYGFVTTNCSALKEVHGQVDCSTPEYTDDFGNKLWSAVGNINARVTTVA